MLGTTAPVCHIKKNIDIQLLITPNKTNNNKSQLQIIYQGMPYVLIFSVITAMTNTFFFLLSFLNMGMVVHTHTVTSNVLSFCHTVFFSFQAE